jgi:HlyD family secretion protein
MKLMERSLFGLAHIRLRRGPRRAWCAALIFVLALGGCRRTGSGPAYETVSVSRGPIVAHVTASGTLSAVESVDVGSQVSGKITALYVDFNSPVKKGQVVAEIDPTLYHAAVSQAQGDLASATATVILKRQNLDRTKQLVPLKAASQSDLDQATAELAQAEAAVIIKRAVLDAAKANLSYCKITAPLDGIVISRNVDLGQTVIAAMNTPLLFTVAHDLRSMYIKADVSEADIGQVKDGEAVDFTVDAFPDDLFHGTVTQVRKAPTTTQNVVSYQTVISVDNPRQKLFPGMTADVSILIADRTNALKIPNAALRFTPPDNAVYDGAAGATLQRNQRLIYCLQDNSAKLKPTIVECGISDGVWTEVLGGVAAGARVVTSTISDGAKGPKFGDPPPRGPQ